MQQGVPELGLSLANNDKSREEVAMNNP